jgi:hypothetical protein
MALDRSLIRSHLHNIMEGAQRKLTSSSSSSFLLGVGWDWVHLVRRLLTGRLYKPRMRDDECWVAGGVRIDRGNRSTRRKPAPVPLCPPQIPHDLTLARTAAVGSRRLTAWAMARLLLQVKMNGFADLNVINIYISACIERWPLLWSSGQSSWLQILRFRVRFPIFWE